MDGELVGVEVEALAKHLPHLIRGDTAPVARDDGNQGRAELILSSFKLGEDDAATPEEDGVEAPGAASPKNDEAEAPEIREGVDEAAFQEASPGEGGRRGDERDGVDVHPEAPVPEEDAPGEAGRDNFAGGEPGSGTACEFTQSRTMWPKKRQRTSLRHSERE
ncbi:hypothetical protein ZWY2020_024428 [Hordeum vulgare]|nr:hypothetical protein ZWY2020_024428 [Hordeum vulgare]